MSGELSTDSSEQIMEVGRDVAAVIQAIAILRAIGSASTGATLSVIARAAGVSRSTTLNIVRTLVNERIVSFSRETKSYRLGIGLLRLAGPLLNRSEFELVEPDLYQIATRFETTASVWLVLDDHRLLLLGRIAPDSNIRIEFRIATRLPRYAGATGLSVAAASGASDEDIAAAIEHIRWAVPPEPKAYLEEAARARRNGFAVDIGNLIRSVTSIATAIQDRSGRPRLVLGVHSFQGQLKRGEIAALGRDLHALSVRAAAALYQAEPLDQPDAGRATEPKAAPIRSRVSRGMTR